MRPTEDIYLHLGGDGTYSLKPDLIPGEAGSLNKSSRCAGASPGSAQRNRGVLAPYYDYIRPQLSYAERYELSLSPYADTTSIIFVSPSQHFN